jgi:hypothetical protein
MLLAAGALALAVSSARESPLRRATRSIRRRRAEQRIERDLDRLAA